MNHDRLFEYLSYDSETGEFTRIKGVKGAGIGIRAGSVNVGGYRVISFDRKDYYEHRLAFVFMGKEMPMLVDHINGIKDDNRWCNLRVATKSANAKNTAAARIAALENCRLYAAIHRHEEWAQTILRFCGEGGAHGSPLRAALNLPS